MATYPILPPSKLVTVTWAYPTTLSVGLETSRALVASMIQRIDTNGSGSALSVVSEGGSTLVERYYVTETPAAIAALTGQHILLTPQDTDLPAFYLNVNTMVGSVIDLTVSGGTGAQVHYTDGGAVLKVNVTQTAAALIAAFNAAIVPDSNTVTAVAAAGTTQGTATALTLTSGTSNYFTITSGTGGVILPAAVAGTIVEINSEIASNVNVYPVSGGFIEFGAVNVPYVLAPDASVRLVSFATGTWTPIPSEKAYVQSVAAAGVSQGTATPVLASYPFALVRVTASAVGATGVILPASLAGMRFVVKNADAADAVALYPATGENFEGVAANTALSIPAGGSIELECTLNGVWSVAASAFQSIWTDTITARAPSGSITVGSPVLVPASGTPIAFVGDTNTGISYQGADTFDLTSGGNTSVRINTGGLEIGASKQIVAPTGAITIAGSGDLDTGLQFNGAGSVDIFANNAVVANVSPTGIAVTGSVLVPDGATNIAAVGDTDTGLRWSAADTVMADAGGAPIYGWDPNFFTVYKPIVVTETSAVANTGSPTALPVGFAYYNVTVNANNDEVAIPNTVAVTEIKINNTSGANALVVRDTGDTTTIATLAAGEVGTFSCFNGTWKLTAQA